MKLASFCGEVAKSAAIRSRLMAGTVRSKVESVCPQASANKANTSVRVLDGLVGGTLVVFVVCAPETRLALPRWMMQLLD